MTQKPRQKVTFPTSLKRRTQILAYFEQVLSIHHSLFSYSGDLGGIFLTAAHVDFPQLTRAPMSGSQYANH